MFPQELIEKLKLRNAELEGCIHDTIRYQAERQRKLEANEASIKFIVFLQEYYKNTAYESASLEYVLSKAADDLALLKTIKAKHP